MKILSNVKFAWGVVVFYALLLIAAAIMKATDEKRMTWEDCATQALETEVFRGEQP